MIGSGAANFLHLIIKLTNISRVYANRTATGLNRCKNILRVEVNISNNGNTRLLDNDRQCFSILIGRAGDTNNVATRCGELCNLLQRCADIVSLRCGHRLNRNGSTPANRHIPHHDLTSLAARKRSFVDAGHP